MSNDALYFSAQWQRRGERADMVAARVRRYLDLVRPSLPADLRWWAYVDDNGTSSLDAENDGARLEALIASSCDETAQGKSQSYMGFSLTLFLSTEDPRTKPAVGAQVRIRAGAANFQNNVTFDSDVYFANKTDSRLATYDALRANMMAVVWSFQPEYCQAAPNWLADYLDGAVYNRPFIGLAWMVWLQASLAEQIMPPRYWNTITERYSDGSLFMATGQDPFTRDDLQHLEKARAIHRQLDHLNYIVPFEGQCGRNPRVPPFPKL